MPYPIFKFSNWKALSKSPTTRSLSKQAGAGVGQFFSAIVSVVGFVVGTIIGGAMTWTATKIWQVITSAFIFAWNFNWNMPDEDFIQAWKNAEIAWYGQLGETLGTALGWLTCGLAPAAVIYTFNPALAAHILLNVGEEAYDEMIGELATLSNIYARNAANRAMGELFIAFRWMVKNVANGEERSSLAEGLVGNVLDAFPKLKEGAKKWGEKGSKPWILSQVVEEAIENLPIETKYQEMLEEMIESFGDSCLEAGYVVAGAIDEWIANQKLVNEATQGQPNTVVITPNRKAPDEKIILHGSVDQLKPNITQTLAQYQLIHNRDIGYDLGTPLIERAHKQISEYVIKLFLRSTIVPPDKKEAQRAEITVNSANPLKFTDYDKIIRALGGGSEGANIGYNYGNFVCVAQMSDGSTLTVRSDNRDNVLARLEAVAELSTAVIRTLNVTEEIKDYERNKIDGLAKSIVRIYPRKMEVIRKTKVYADYDKSYNTPGRLVATKEGYYKDSAYTLDLWQGEKPSDWDEIIQVLTAPIVPV